MFGLCFRLALTNLKKNRRLYYPYAIMTIVSIAISYIFASLAFYPDLGQVKGANGVTQVLGVWYDCGHVSSCYYGFICQ